MADYCTEAQAKSLGVQTDALLAATWPLLITSASRLFDKLVEVDDDYFAVGDLTEPYTYSDRTFVGDGTAYLKLPPYIELNPTDPVTINEGTIDDEDFIIDNVPDYAEQNGYLVVLGRTTGHWPHFGGVHRFTGWPDGKQIEVSANWGFTAIPSEVTRLTAHLALFLWRNGDVQAADGIDVVTPALIDGIPAVVWSGIEAYKRKYSQAAIFA